MKTTLKPILTIKLSGDNSPRININVDSLEKASAIQSAYISFFNHGGSSYTGGLLTGLSKPHYISYNGRVWVGAPTKFYEINIKVEIDREEANKLHLIYYKQFDPIWDLVYKNKTDFKNQVAEFIQNLVDGKAKQ